jgi:hypothetical protein
MGWTEGASHKSIRCEFFLAAMNVQTMFDNKPSFLRSSISVCSTSSSTVSVRSKRAFLERYQVVIPTVIADMASSDDEKQLASDFQPTEFDIICGRGKGHYNRPGCKRLREVIRGFIPEYLAAKSKVDKSAVISRILDAVKSQNNSTTRFVKCKKGTWYEIGDDQAREKVGHTMRETIALLKSKPSVDQASTTAKITLAQRRRCEEQHQQLLPFSYGNPHCNVVATASLPLGCGGNNLELARLDCEIGTFYEV